MVRMAQSSSRRGRRRSTPFYLRWLSVFVSMAVIRTVWKSVALTRQSPSAVIGDGTNDAPQYAHDDYSILPILRGSREHQRSRAKRPRKNPSRQSLESASLRLDSTTISSSARMSDETINPPNPESSVVVQQQPKQSAKKFKDESSHWNYLCQGGDEKSSGRTKKLSSKSRVLISGSSTHSAAVELAVALSTHCHVKTIMGLSNQSPDDSEIPPRAAYLLRRMDDKDHEFQLVHHDTVFSQERFDTLIASFEPTHVVHFEATTFLSSPDNESSSSSSLATIIPPIIRVRQSLDTLDRLGRAIVTWQQNRPKKKDDSSSSSVRLLYVSTPLSRDQSIYQAGALDSLYPLLLETFRAHYNLDVIHLKLPHIYGPFHESKLSAASLVPSSSMPATTTTTTIDDNQSIIHVDDCVESLVASISSATIKNETSLPQIQVPPSSLTSTNEIIHTFQNNSLTSGRSKLSNDRVRLMLSWNHQDLFPFEEPNDVYKNETKSIFRKALATTNRRLISNKTAGISQLQQRQNALFPCDSECAANAPCQQTSVFSELLPISQNLTQNCRYVVYTTNFSSDVSDLPWIKPNISVDVPWPKDLLCQVAYVSGKSNLVRSLVKKEQKEVRSHTLDMGSLNGRLQHNRWWLIWLPDDDETSLSEADYLFPKLSPRPFFAHNVTKSMYMQPREDAKYPPLPVIWFRLRSLDAKKQAGRMKHAKRSGTSVEVLVALPDVPARHVALFAHSMGIPSSFLQSSSMEAVAKFVLKKNGIDHSSSRSLPERQLEYYDFAKSWYEFELPDTFTLIHNLESDRSQRLRCEWYEEHLFWADDDRHSNRNLEDLSLAHVLGRWRGEQRLVASDDYSEQWGDRIVDTAKGDLLDISNSSEPQLSQYFVKLHAPVKYNFNSEIRTNR